MSTPGFYELSRQSTTPVTNVVHAVQFIRKMRGGSQPALIRCDDDKLYVVKFFRNQQGPNVLANEVLGNELLSSFNLPTPQWRTVFVSISFLRENSDVSFETQFGSASIESGLHFGSEFLGGEKTGQAYEWLPKGLSSRVTNPEDFLGIHIFDVWTNHCDHRQTLFTTTDGNASFRAVFFDNGHLFGGPAWKLVSRKGESLGLDRRFHTSEWPAEAIDAWIYRFETRRLFSLFDVVPRIPKLWYSGDIHRVIGSLADRLSSLRTRFGVELTQKHVISRLSCVDLTDAKLSLHRLELPRYGNLRTRAASCLTSGVHGRGR
jgi:HipA-like protein